MGYRLDHNALIQSWVVKYEKFGLGVKKGGREKYTETETKRRKNKKLFRLNQSVPHLGKYICYGDMARLQEYHYA